MSEILGNVLEGDDSGQAPTVFELHDFYMRGCKGAVKPAGTFTVITGEVPYPLSKEEE